ncbi:MAG: 5'-methylthioadenosine/S-adenosylhomocysteine nucleosidase [Aeromonadaceae bacterium]|nr:5'-methylthioadenosine/S-adenosylhomocysteine nucleosidase [Aeromonadaceae bacterium]
MRVGIIGAMEQEVTLLREQMSDLQTLQLAGCEFYSGTLAGKAVVLTRSGIGKVAAAVATTLLLERFAPDCVINTGSAGGFDPALHIGDVVISSEVRHHDVDVTAFGYEIGQVPRLPAAFVCDAGLIAVAQQAVADLADGIQCKLGLVCTGDQFMCDPARIAKARADFPQMAAVEMEGAAIAQVCHQFAVPFVVTRSLSDIAGKESPESFDAYLETASRHSSAMVVAMLKRLTP